MPDSFESLLCRDRERVEKCLSSYLFVEEPNSLMLEAMRYGTLGGGKRIRAVLVYLASIVVHGEFDRADAAASAVEMIHAYSLIHDDLPAMDDDDLRRGKPSCHVAFGEATAILAGDALQARAFEVLANDESNSVTTRLEMIKLLTAAVGGSGLVGGQAVDLEKTGSHMTLSELEWMHQRKTGDLIVASLQLGALSGDRVTPETLEALSQYGHAIGLAFQIQDDILDVEGDSHSLGKTAGKDQMQGKSTYSELLGLDGARQKAEDCISQALLAIESLGSAAEPLRQMAGYIIHRNA